MGLLLKKASNNMAYLKAGIFGPTGGGKTFTACLIAIGLHKLIKSKKPIAFFDTETGSNYLIPMFEKAGIELLQAQCRSLADLCDTIDEAENSCDILITDSITHVWREFTTAYQEANNRKFIQLWDWKPIKDEWYNSFTTRYLNSKLHIIMCGREGNIYEDQEDQQNIGKMKSVKVGTKMNAETETGYEPGLLLEMSKNFSDPEGDGGTYFRKCHVIKDRFDMIDSKTFNNPKFENFLPHINALNLDGNHFGIDENGSSEEMFDGRGDGEYYKKQQAKKICLEEITEEIKKYFPGSSAGEKAFRQDLMEYVFNTRSWTKIENSDILFLEIGLKILRGLLPQWDGEKTLKEFLKKVDITKDDPEEPDPKSVTGIIHKPLDEVQLIKKCPDTGREVPDFKCEEECDHREGCPEHYNEDQEEKDVPQ